MLSMRARLGNKSRLVLSLLRSHIDACHERSNLSQSKHLVNSQCHFSSQPNGARKTEELESCQTDSQNESQDMGADSFTQLFDYSKQKFARRCEYLLTDWNRQVNQLKCLKQPVDLKTIVSKRLSQMVNFILTPSSPPDLRVQCLQLLLSEESDQGMTSELLEKTVRDSTFLPVKVIVDIVQALSTCHQTQIRKDIRKKLVAALVNQRWYDISSRHIVFVMYQLNELFDMKKVKRHQHKQDTLAPDVSETVDASREEDFLQHGELSDRSEGDGDESIPIMLKNLEARAGTLVHELRVKDLARIVILLAKWGSRSQTLLNSIFHRLCQADLSEFNFIQLNNLLYSLSVLNIQNEQVIRQVVLQLSEVTPSSATLACASLSSLSHLRFNDPVLVSRYLHFLAEHMSELTVKDAHSVLMSLANLYAVPSTQAEADFVAKLAAKVFSGNVTPADKVNCAWCLAILVSLGAELGKSLLQPEFAMQFSDADSFQNEACLQKLTAINTAFQYEVANYTGPFLTEQYLKPAAARTGCTDKALRSTLVNTLGKFVDLKTYTKFCESLEGGIVADVVMCASSSGEVRPLQHCQKTDQMFKLAIQVVPFSGVLNPSQTPTGSYNMTARHLKHLGYVPVQILYSDLSSSKTVLEKINMIKTKVQSAVQDASAANQS